MLRGAPDQRLLTPIPTASPAPRRDLNIPTAKHGIARPRNQVMCRIEVGQCRALGRIRIKSVLDTCPDPGSTGAPCISSPSVLACSRSLDVLATADGRQIVLRAVDRPVTAHIATVDWLTTVRPRRSAWRSGSVAPQPFPRCRRNCDTVGQRANVAVRWWHRPSR